MGDLTPSPGPDGPVNQVGRGQIPTLRIFGMEIPLPPWAVSVLAVVAIIAVVVIFVFAIIHYRDDQTANKKIEQQRKELEKQQEELEEQQKKLNEEGEKVNLAGIEYNESNLHRREQSLDKEFKKAKVLVQLYGSDGCVWVTRSGSKSTWLPDPKKISPAPSPKPGDNVIGWSRAPGLSMHRSESLVPQALAQPVAFSPALFRRGGQMALAQQGSPCGRKCQNPHPGEFRSWEGRRQDCWVQVWREWQDGCKHYQWYNKCYSYWDSDERGQPRVYWTCCTH